jgi:hypothetical protein
MNDNNFDIEMQMEVMSQAYQFLLPPQGRHYWHHLSHLCTNPTIVSGAQKYALWPSFTTFHNTVAEKKP